MVLFVAALLPVGPSGAEGERVTGEPVVRAERIVSLNPSLTGMLLAIGARGRLVGVDDYSARLHDDVAGLPRVGGLFTPSLEGVAALAPDLVVLVKGVEQRDFEQRLAALGIPSMAFENTRIEQVIENIESLGALTGEVARAAERVAAIRRSLEATERRAAAWPRIRTLLVLQREPLYVVGRGNFIAEMLARAGGINVGDALTDPYPRVAMEWVIAQAPELVIDLSDDPDPPQAFWARYASVPAVRDGRVMRLAPELISMPGPELDRALLELVRGLRGEEEADRLAAEVSASVDAEAAAR